MAPVVRARPLQPLTALLAFLVFRALPAPCIFVAGQHRDEWGGCVHWY